MCLRVYKNSLFPRCWNVYFTLDSQEPAEERASVIYTSTSEQRQQGMKKGWGRMNRIGSDRARESLEYFGSARGNSKLRNCTWRRCLYLKTNKRKTVWKGKASNSSFFPLQIIMSTTGKYSRAVCQSYRESSKSLKFKAYILNKKVSLVVSVPFCSRLRRHLQADKQNLAFSRRLDSGARR